MRILENIVIFQKGTNSSNDPVTGDAVRLDFISCVVETSWNVMAHAQNPDFVFRRKGRVHLNRRRGLQFSRKLAAEMCASGVVMLDTPCSEVVWRVLATHCVRQFPLHFPSRASPCVITFQLKSTRFHDQLTTHNSPQSVWHGTDLGNEAILGTVPKYMMFDSKKRLRHAVYL
jgi:hypothetical protein